MTPTIWTAPKAANRLNRIVETFCAVHGTARFPVDVVELALQTATVFNWDDPITEVREADIPGFEGCLAPNETRTKWLLLYNKRLPSPGRIRFTQAHELGHYILHRLLRDKIECSEDDMLEWSKDELNLEAQADLFASYLLMPLNDFREQVTSPADLDMLGECANRYGVSLTAAVLKWLDITDDKAILVRSTDGFLNWAWSSDRAWKSGAFFATRNHVIPVPAASLAGNDTVQQDRRGVEIPARVWFKHAPESLALREMKVTSERYGSIWSLLCLPRGADVWPPRPVAAD